MKKLFTLFLTTILFFLVGCDGLNIKYTVTYNSTYGITPDPIQVVDGTVLTQEQLPTLSEDGYIFKGWFDGTTQAKAGEYTVESNVTLTAKWEKEPVKTYEVSFSTEHGTTPAKITVEENTKLTAIQLPSLSAEGFTFIGWFDGETQAYPDAYVVTKNVTLTAKWEVVPPKTFEVTYSSEHATAPSKITVEENTKLTAAQLPALTAEGFTFNGWFDGETQAKADEYIVTKDVTLTAKWEVIPPKTFVITYITEHGTAPEKATAEDQTVFSAELLPVLTDENEEYDFICWRFKDSETSVTPGHYLITKDITLVAFWIAKPPKVSKFVGTYEYIIEDSGMNIPVKFKFDNNNTINAYVVIDLGMTPTFLCFKGTYEVSNYKVTITYDETQFSTCYGYDWENVEDDQLGLASQCLDILKTFDFKYVTGLEYNNGTEYVSMPDASAHLEIEGAWENAQIQSRLLFKGLDSIETAMITHNGSILYTKGDCLFVGNYLLFISYGQSDDYTTWNPLTAAESKESMYSSAYELNNNELTFMNTTFTKMSGTDITYPVNPGFDGSYDFVLNDSDMDIPVRFMFNQDNTLNAIASFDSSIFGGEQIVFYYYKGTYSVNSNAVCMTFDETQFSLSNGASWLTPEDDTLGLYESLLDVLKSFNFTVSTAGNLQYNDGTTLTDCPAAVLTDSALTGAWENEDHNMRMLFKDDNSFYMGEHTPDEYGKGTYVILNGVLQIVCTESSTDYATWTPEQTIMNMVFPYTISEGTLDVGQNYTKLNSDTINW